MAIANFTEDGKQRTLDRLQCFVDLRSGMRYQLTGILWLNILMSVTTFLGNTLILVALRKDSSLHPPSKLLHRCLATTDLCVGLIAQPIAVLQWTAVLNEHWNICCNVTLLESANQAINKTTNSLIYTTNNNSMF